MSFPLFFCQLLFYTKSLLEKWMQDITDAMLTDGSLPGTIPTAGWGYQWGNGPVSDGILFEIPYRVYLHTGSYRLLVENLDYFKRYLRYLEGQKSSEGLVEFGLDDWAAPGNIHVVETGFINAVLMYSFYKITHLAAKLAGSSDAFYYLDEAARLKDFIIKRYIDSQGYCTINEQCAVSMLIYYDIYDDITPLKSQLATLIKNNDFHLKCGMVGLRRLLLALNKCNLADYAYKVLTADGYPGFKVWFDKGATTLWEKWDVNKLSDSKNHHMYSDFMSWIIKTLAGISINEEKCGELEFVLDPVFLDEIYFVDFNYHTVCGEINICWKKIGGKIILDVKKDSGVKLVYKGDILKNDKNRFEL